MTRERVLAGVAVAAGAAILGWVLFIGLPRWTSGGNGESPAPEGAPAADRGSSATPKIKARLFYVSEDGMRLDVAEREVEFAESPTEQARQILEAQLRAPEPPLVSAVPTGTTLRGLFLTERGEAYVDLSGEVARAHAGGSLDEIFTVYTIVNALTENLPAIRAVQILVDGREVDTLAGHVDLRRPLSGDLRWTRAPDAEPAAQ